MNIKEYIESGILEAYVLGALNDNEHAEVQANIAMYPELADEVRKIEESLLQLAEASAVTPPSHLQEQIWNTIKEQDATPIPAETPAGNIINFSQQQSKNSWLRAAIWLLLIGSVLLNIILLAQRNNIQEERLVLQEQIDSIVQQQRYLSALITDYRKEMDMMADTNMQTIVMKSIVPGHPMAATVYWNRSNGEAYLAMKKLPMPPQGMQYQMWVIQDGKPVSMGVLPNDMVSDNVVAQIPMVVKDGQAFAISLEKKGGSVSPTVENIYVMGKV